MLYVDTSVLVTAFTIETRTAEIQKWLVSDHPEPLAASDWTITEFSSAVSVKIRNNQLGEHERRKALALFEELRMTTFETFPVGRSCFIEAARLTDQYDFGLGSGDALRLAIAIYNDATSITLDKGLAKASAVVGAKYQLL